MQEVAHATSLLFAIGMMVFFWMIYKKTRKVHKRGQKAKRRLLKHKTK
jgi:preprotein translocase subunit YajC